MTDPITARRRNTDNKAAQRARLAPFLAQFGTRDAETFARLLDRTLTDEQIKQLVKWTKGQQS